MFNTNYLSDSLNAFVLLFGGFALLIASSCPSLGAVFLFAGATKFGLTTWGITFVDLAALLRTGTQRVFA